MKPQFQCAIRRRKGFEIEEMEVGLEGLKVEGSRGLYWRKLSKREREKKGVAKSK